MADLTYDEWLAHRELDRMPDPHRNPCEAVEAENERLRDGIESLIRQYRRFLPSVVHDLRAVLAASKQEGPDDA